MSIFTETKPHEADWIALEQERILREKLGEPLYIWAGIITKEREKKDEN